MNGTSWGMLAKTTSLAQPMPSRSAVRSAAQPDRPAHQRHGVHVDAGGRRGHVDRGADAPGARERLGDRLDQRAVAVREALLDEGGKPAEEVAAQLAGDLVETLGDRAHLLGGEAAGGDRDRADRDPLVDDRDAVAQADLVADLDQVAGEAGDLGAHALDEPPGVLARAVEEADAERHGAHVEVLAAEHLERARALRVQSASAHIRWICSKISRCWRFTSRPSSRARARSAARNACRSVSAGRSTS